jgi:hypothetical protein
MSNNENNDINEKENNEAGLAEWRVQIFNNLTPRRVLRVPDVQQTSTGKTIKKKILSLAKEEGRRIPRTVN